MAVIRTFRSILLVLVFIAICCGCSKGNGSPITPGNSPNQPYNPTRFISDQYGSADDCFNSDPRFRGWTDSDFADKYDFDWTAPPDWALPGIGDIEFDRVLKGWIVDPHHKVNTLTLTVTVDDNFDLSKDLTYTGEVLPDGGYLYHWECISPEKLLDSQRHLVKVNVFALDNTPLMNIGNPVFKPLVLPGIGAVYYPWRDVKLPVEEQKFDSMRILIFIDGDLYPEWVDLIRPVEVWNIKGYGNPMSVEFEQLDSDWPIAILNLKEPITMDTDLEFGPVNLEDGLIAFDSESIIVDGADREAQGGPPECNMDIHGVGHHDYIQTEDFAWCLEVTGVPTGYPIPRSSGGSVIFTPTCFSDPLDIGNWSLTGDQCSFDACSVHGFAIIGMEGGFNTRTFSGDAMRQIEASWEIENPPCIPPPPYHTITVTDNFTAVDTTNPVFLEPPRLVYGPEAADWLEPYYNDDDWIKVFAWLNPEFLRADTCGIYLLIMTEDPGPPGSLGLGSNPISMDLMVNGNIVNYVYPGYYGSFMWYDNVPVADPPPPGDEYDYWLDPNCPPPSSFSPNKVWKDGYRLGEKYIDVISMDSYLSIQGLEEVKVRVTDYRDNWTRSGNLLEDTDKPYTVTNVGIIEENYQGTTVLADLCSVPIGDRYDGLYVLEYVAQVLTSDLLDPPPYIPSVISAPNHEGTAGPAEINVPIYRIDPESDRYDDYNELFPPVNSPCNVQYYSRESDLLIPPGSVDPVILADSMESEQPLNESDYETCPILFLSDTDDLLGTEGDLNNTSWMDYSITMTCDPVNSYYSNAIDDMYFGTSKRGTLYNCDYDDSKYNYWEDNFHGGFERVMVNVGNYTADIGVQSRGDAYFVIGHGNAQNWTPNMDEELVFVDRFGPFIYPAPNGQCSTDMTIQDWNNSLIDPEVDYLITNACALLTTASYPSWQTLIPDRLDSICGFRGFNDRNELPLQLQNDPSPFFAGFSWRLTAYYGEVMNPTYWGFTNIPDDPAIIAWMENACEWAIYASVPQSYQSLYPVALAASIDSNFRYSLKLKRKYWFSPEYDWYIVKD